MPYPHPPYPHSAENPAQSLDEALLGRALPRKPLMRHWTWLHTRRLGSDREAGLHAVPPSAEEAVYGRRCDARDPALGALPPSLARA